MVLANTVSQVMFQPPAIYFPGLKPVNLKCIGTIA